MGEGEKEELLPGIGRQRDTIPPIGRELWRTVLESLREDLTYARLNNGSRVLDVADFRQYICEQMARIRTNALVTATLYGTTNGDAQDVSKSGGHNGRVHS
jgi:hypothetical protein